MFESFLGVNPWTALFILLNTLTIYFVAKKFLFVPVMNMIAERQQEIDGMYAAAGEAQQQAEANGDDSVDQGVGDGTNKRVGDHARDGQQLDDGQNDHENNDLTQRVLQESLDRIFLDLHSEPSFTLS